MSILEPVNHHRPVHPHARGEHFVLGPNFNGTCGSSPRPWGTSVFPVNNPVGSRFIPTPVGNMKDQRIQDLFIAVHPHARGEHSFSICVSISCTGSSPRPWGTYPFPGFLGVHHRFIPTPVGNMPAAPPMGPPISGSSPRPWGTCVGIGRRRLRERFIPTPVGNIIVTPKTLRAVSVHPHARGEHYPGP